jgi:hypothetical protein
VGAVGPKNDQAELLHPKLVAVWAREDIGMNAEDFHSCVAGASVYVPSMRPNPLTLSLLQLSRTSIILYVDNLPLLPALLTCPFLAVDLSCQSKRRLLPAFLADIASNPRRRTAAPATGLPIIPAWSTTHHASSERSRTLSSPPLRSTILSTLRARPLALCSTPSSSNSSNRWFDSAEGREHEFVRTGMKILAKARIAIDAEGRSPIPIPRGASSASTVRPARPTVAIPGSSRQSSQHLYTLLTLAHLVFPATTVSVLKQPASAISAYASPITPSSTASSTPSSAEDNRPLPLPASRRPQPPSPLDTTTDTEDENDTPRFVREVEAQAERRGCRRAKSLSKMQRLEHAVDDWELMSDDPDARPLRVRDPLYDNPRSSRR